MLFITGHDFGGWWIGSHLDIHTSRQLCSDMAVHVGVIGPTALQVGASLAAAVCWGIQNPNSGAHFPESLPTDFILELVKPWLGTWVSIRHNWLPTCTPEVRFEKKFDRNFPLNESESDSESGESDESELLKLGHPELPRSRSFSLTSDASSSSQSRSMSRSPSPLSMYSNDSNDLWQFTNFLATPIH